MPAVIEVVDLRRSYRSSTGSFRRKVKTTEALRGVSFDVAEGELFGLLGPNGAGKTTTIKILTTLLLPSSGAARVLGVDVARDARQVRQRIGYVFGGDRGLYDRLSAWDNLGYFADVYRVPAREQKRRISELIGLVGLTGREGERVETYSRGMKQRLHIARGLLHDPPVLFLDEPTIGLDPVGGRDLRDLIRNLRDAGKTVLLTTHYMFEADELCDRVAVIKGGEIIALGTPASLKQHVADRHVVEIEVWGGADEAAVQRVRDVPGVAAVTVENLDQRQLLIVQSSQGAELVEQLLHSLAGSRIGRVVSREPTLEDAYVALVKDDD